MQENSRQFCRKHSKRHKYQNGNEAIFLFEMLAINELDSCWVGCVESNVIIKKLAKYDVDTNDT